MADHFEIRQDERGWAVFKNNRWYSDVEDEQDGIGMVRNLRAPNVTVVDSSGYKTVRKYR